MSSLFGRLKGNTVPGSLSVGTSPNKKAGPAVPQTPLEKLLEDAGPQRQDGSDKFFGMHNANNTCYLNSVVQCLYFSEPFREQIINYPRRGRRQSAPMPETSNNGQAVQSPTLLSPRTPAVEKSDPFAPKKPVVSPTSVSSPIAQQENKDAWDYQKKVAMQAGPHLRVETGFSDTYGMEESLFTALKDLFEAIVAHQSRTGVITPAKLLEVLRDNNETFNNNTHQDAHEFLNAIFSAAVDEVEKHSKRNAELQNGLVLEIPPVTPQAGKTALATSSWIHDLFEGTLTSETRCLTCENISRRDETFLDLSVDLEEHSSVTSCLRKFSEEEMLCERNKFHCDQCSGLQEAEKRMKIKRLPRILTLHLKRFRYYEESGYFRKLFHRVVYPFHLRILNTTDDVDDPDRLYELYGVVVHLGNTAYHGHYVAIVKTKDDGWLLLDDEIVLPVDKNYVRNFFGDPRSPASAYVLFYQETTEEAVQREQEAEDDLVDVPIADYFEDQGSIPNTVSEGVESPTLTAQTVPTPAIEESDPFVSRLEHASTAPSMSPPLEPEGAEEVNPMSRTSMEEEQKSQSKGPFGSLKKSGNFDRFRNTSISMRSKPKFWQSKDKEVADRDGTLVPDAAPIVSPEPKEVQVEKRKSRFSLGRKKLNLQT